MTDVDPILAETRDLLAALPTELAYRVNKTIERRLATWLLERTDPPAGRSTACGKPRSKPRTPQRHGRFRDRQWPVFWRLRKPRHKRKQLWDARWARRSAPWPKNSAWKNTAGGGPTIPCSATGTASTRSSEPPEAPAHDPNQLRSRCGPQSDLRLRSAASSVTHAR